jgi:hypothetical protein
MVAILACSWLAGCAAQQQTAGPPAVPSAGAPSATGQPSSASSGSSSNTGASSNSGSSTQGGASSDKGSASEKAASGGTATAGGQEASGGAGDASAEEGSETAGGGPAAQTPDEKRDTLDRNLQASLGAFDAMLLKEQVEAAARRAEHGTGAGSGSGSGSGGEGEGSGEGEGEGAGGSEASAGDEKRSGSQGQEAGGGSKDKGGSGGQDKATGSSGPREPREGGRDATSDPEGAPHTAGADDASRVPEDVGDGRDDDVVARQLREAAMSEEDPAIREKLWDEYRRYKRGES